MAVLSTIQFTKEHPVRKANIVSAIVGMAFSGTAFIITFSFRQFKNVPVGPEFFPRILATGLFLCSFILLLQALAANPKKDKPAPTISPLNKGMQRLFAGIGIIVLYAICWEPVGFIIATPLAMFGMMLLLGFRKYLTMVIFSLGTTAVIFAAFRIFLYVDMPLGLLEYILYY
jgi:putative tricarboxylic transport membrane protein